MPRQLPNRLSSLLFTLAPLAVAVTSCNDSSPVTSTQKDPDTAEKASIDRFSDKAATLMRRSAAPSLPASNQAINFDQGAPFVTEGLGPRGEKVKYYNFDVAARTPAPIYAFVFPTGASVPGQLNVVDVIPGEPGYNDFWQVHQVTVPASYLPNTVTSLAEISAAGFQVQATQMLVNCPIVPDGSVASVRLNGEPSGLHTGWYKGQVVKYFSFSERALNGGAVPLAPIFVTFNVNPDQPGGGPGSGFEAEPASSQTHNVVTALPAEDGYSPLWSVNVYDNTAFATVSSLATAQAAPLLGTAVANVNCPVVEVE